MKPCDLTKGVVANGNGSKNWQPQPAACSPQHTGRGLHTIPHIYCSCLQKARLNVMSLVANTSTMHHCIEAG